MASKSLPSTAAVLSAGLLPAERTAARKVLSRLDITCNERRAEHDIAHDECVLVVIGMDLDVMTRIVQRCKKALVIGVGVLASRPSLGVLASLQVQRTFYTRLIAPPGLPDTFEFQAYDVLKQELFTETLTFIDPSSHFRLLGVHSNLDLDAATGHRKLRQAVLHLLHHARRRCKTVATFRNYYNTKILPVALYAPIWRALDEATCAEVDDLAAKFMGRLRHTPGRPSTAPAHVPLKTLMGWGLRSIRTETTAAIARELCVVLNSDDYAASMPALDMYILTHPEETAAARRASAEQASLAPPPPPGPAAAAPAKPAPAAANASAAAQPAPREVATAHPPKSANARRSAARRQRKRQARQAAKAAAAAPPPPSADPARHATARPAPARRPASDASPLTGWSQTADASARTGWAGERPRLDPLTAQPAPPSALTKPIPQVVEALTLCIEVLSQASKSISTARMRATGPPGAAVAAVVLPEAGEDQTPTALSNIIRSSYSNVNLLSPWDLRVLFQIPANFDYGDGSARGHITNCVVNVYADILTHHCRTTGHPDIVALGTKTTDQINTLHFHDATATAARAIGGTARLARARHFICFHLEGHHWFLTLTDRRRRLMWIACSLASQHANTAAKTLAFFRALPTPPEWGPVDGAARWRIIDLRTDAPAQLDWHQCGIRSMTTATDYALGNPLGTMLPTFTHKTEQARTAINRARRGTTRAMASGTTINTAHPRPPRLGVHQPTPLLTPPPRAREAAPNADAQPAPSQPQPQPAIVPRDRSGGVAPPRPTSRRQRQPPPQPAASAAAGQGYQLPVSFMGDAIRRIAREEVHVRDRQHEVASRVDDAHKRGILDPQAIAARIAIEKAVGRAGGGSEHMVPLAAVRAAIAASAPGAANPIPPHLRTAAIAALDQMGREYEVETMPYRMLAATLDPLDP